MQQEATLGHEAHDWEDVWSPEPQLPLASGSLSLGFLAKPAHGGSLLHLLRGGSPPSCGRAWRRGAAVTCALVASAATCTETPLR